MLRMLKNTLIMSVVMLAVLAIASYAHAIQSSGWMQCSHCHDKQESIVLEKTDSTIYRNAKFKMKRIFGDPSISVYVLTIDDNKSYILNSKGGIVEYK